MGWPSRFITRPRVPVPTGTEIMPGVDDRHAAGEAVGGVHGDGAHDVVAQVLGDFQDEVARLVADGRVADTFSAVRWGQLALGELHVEHGAQHLGDAFRWGVRGC
jgi:hypothetical protein